MGKRKRQKATPKKAWQLKFLLALGESPNVTAAARSARKNRQYVYRVRALDPAFAVAWDDALAQSIDMLEGEMYRRAVHGTSKPVYQGGQHVGDVQEYSDTLAIFMAKAHRPEKYREHIRIDVNALDEAIAAELARVAGLGKTEDAGAAEADAVARRVEAAEAKPA